MRGDRWPSRNLWRSDYIWLELRFYRVLEKSTFCLPHLLYVCLISCLCMVMRRLCGSYLSLWMLDNVLLHHFLITSLKSMCILVILIVHNSIVLVHLNVSPNGVLLNPH